MIAARLEPVAGQTLADLDDYYRPENYDRRLY